MRTDLEPKFEKAKSYYGKAVVEEQGKVTRLYSYKSLVAEITVVGLDDTRVKLYSVYDDDGNNLTFSKTTMRHIKEFLLQNGLVAESKRQIMKDYEVVG